MSPETRAYLRMLEDRFVLETFAGEMLAVHGSPQRINEYLFEDRPETSLARLAAANPSGQSCSATRTSRMSARPPARPSSTWAAAGDPRTATGGVAMR